MRRAGVYGADAVRGGHDVPGAECVLFAVSRCVGRKKGAGEGTEVAVILALVSNMMVGKSKTEIRGCSLLFVTFIFDM